MKCQNDALRRAVGPWAAELLPVRMLRLHREVLEQGCRTADHMNGPGRCVDLFLSPAGLNEATQRLNLPSFDL